MLFVLQKILWFLILPPASLLILIISGLIIVERRKRAGRACIFSGLILLYALSLSPVADFILKPLESAYPPLSADHIRADAVVVPGGGSVDLKRLGAGPVPNAETTERLVKGVELAKKLDVPLVLTGGNGEPFSTELNDAEVMAAAALRMGISRAQMTVENQSRNTLENSLAVRKLLSGNRIVLATSAYYMRRAATMFKRRGFTVYPAPVYFLTESRKLNAACLIPGASHLLHSSTGIAEWMSRAWWGLRGEI